jgi:cell division protein FtsA
MRDDKYIITGIDIGTTKIAVVIAQCSNEDEQMKILGVGTSVSQGLKRGVVVDIQETLSSIRKAVTDAEKQADVEVESAFVGLTGDHIKGINYSGVITVSKNSNRQPIGHEISQGDIDRVHEHAQMINLSPDRRILHVLPQEFKVDDKGGIKNPLGLSGHRLEAKVHLVTSAINTEKDLRTCMEKAGIEVDGFILEPLASSYSVLDKNERNLGVILIDIGGGTSDVIVFHDDAVLHAGAIPLGGDNITKDIAYGVQTTYESAEKLKCEYGSAKVALSSPEEAITIKGTSGRESKTISQKELAEIIEPRMEEIFKLAQYEIRKSEFPGEFTFGIVLTGGGSKLNHITDLAQDVFQQVVKMGCPNLTGGISDEVNNPRYATAVGLIHYGHHQWEDRVDNEKMKLNSLFLDIFSKIKNFFKTWY